MSKNTDIVMLTTAAGPEGVFPKGAVRTLPSEQAQELIDKRYARLALPGEKAAWEKKQQSSLQRLVIN